jgi:hypothetical protein
MKEISKEENNIGVVISMRQLKEVVEARKSAQPPRNTT